VRETDTSSDADSESEDVSHQVGPFTPRTGEGEQGETGYQGGCPLEWRGTA